jgi:single-stranded DNA-binding protein
MMDQNLVVVAGRLATPPEIKTYDSGQIMLRFLVTTRATEPRRRVDVIPVTLWSPDDELLAQIRENKAPSGTRIWIAGSVQRRFWEADNGRRSRIEVVAEQAKLLIEEDPFDQGPFDLGATDEFAIEEARAGR